MRVEIATQCPSEAEIDLCSLNAIADERQLAKLEAHLLVNVGERLTLADHTYAAMMRAVLARFDIVQIDIHAVHETGEGNIFLCVSEGAENCWTARMYGCEVDRWYIANSRAEAVRHNDMAFRSLFPEHACSSHCKRRK
jgi:hypothetical protein